MYGAPVLKIVLSLSQTNVLSPLSESINRRKGLTTEFRGFTECDHFTKENTMPTEIKQ